MVAPGFAPPPPAYDGLTVLSDAHAPPYFAPDPLAVATSFGSAISFEPPPLGAPIFCDVPILHPQVSISPFHPLTPAPAFDFAPSISPVLSPPPFFAPPPVEIIESPVSVHTVTHSVRPQIARTTHVTRHVHLHPEEIDLHHPPAWEASPSPLPHSLHGSPSPFGRTMPLTPTPARFPVDHTLDATLSPTRRMFPHVPTSRLYGSEVFV